MELFSHFKKFTIGYQVLAAVCLGIFVGLFFGPLAAHLKPLGDIFLMLLQLVVLPYIAFTLIHGLGSLSPELGKRLFRCGWPFLALLWCIALLVVYIGCTFLPTPHLVFYGQSGVKSSFTEKLLPYIVPDNLFYDLANNIVPAIAVFGLIVGVALMHLEKKEPLLSILERTNQVIEKILQWIALLSPIGIFAHISVAAGTIRFEDLYKLEFYVLAFIGLTLLVVLWILPSVLTSLTPLTYKETFKAFKSVCLLAFATGVPSLSLPFLNYYMKKLEQKNQLADAQFHSTSQTVMPIAYGFGQLGNLMMVFFIYFLCFYYRHPLQGGEKFALTVFSIPLSFGSSLTSVNAVRFLIDGFNFPGDAGDLYIETMPITLNFQVLMSVACVLTLIILVLYSYYGLLQVRLFRLFTHLGATFLSLGALAFAFHHFVPIQDNYRNLYTDLDMASVIDKAPSVSIISNPSFINPPGLDPLSSILKREVLRVGYSPQSIPYCFWNDKNQLVGYDIAYAYQLALDLDCSLELIEVDLDNMADELVSGRYDIVMSAIIMNEQRIEQMDFTNPYTEQANTLVIPISKKGQFLDLTRVQERPDLKIGGVGGYYQATLRHFPHAQAVSINDMQPLLDGSVDAVMWACISGFTWCLSNPDYMIVDYGTEIGVRFFSYPVRPKATDWLSFLNKWLALKEQSGFKNLQEKYWIKGEGIPKKEPRWSILNTLRN